MAAPGGRRSRSIGALLLVGLVVLAVVGAILAVPRIRDLTSSPVAPPRSSAAPPSFQPTTDQLPADGRPVQKIPSVRPSGFVQPPPGQGLDRYRRQRVAWERCGQIYFCASVRAPLDYAKPDGIAIMLAMAKKPATGSTRRGSLFINPGGPGGSGRQYVTFFNNGGLEDYDVVGWDPRGVGASTPVQCFGDADLDRYFAVDVSPDDLAELQAFLDANLRFGRSCLARSGALLQHISTTETVRDLDLLRELVGDQKINYFGSSYGTQIGALYAQLYPRQVGRMVLDGAVNITDDDSVPQVQGFERALGNFAQWCADQRCVLGSSRDDVLYLVKTYLDSLDVHPMTVGDRLLTQSMGVSGITAPLYQGVSGWKPLLAGLVSAIQDGNGAGMLQLADQGNFRDDKGHFDQLDYSFPAIRCLDSQDTSVRKAEQEAVTQARKAPVLGQLGGADVVCPLWPVKPAPQPPKITADEAPPILVIGTTGDPATPYEYAESMARQLTSGVLITYQGDGHLAYDRSDCVRTAVQGYLIQDHVPIDGLRCNS